MTTVRHVSPPGGKRPRRRSPRDSARDAFRRELREAAEQVFARTGFQATKMADVAAQAGVAVGTLYNYFDSKEEIFQEIFEKRSRELRALLEPVLAGGPPRAGLEGIVRTTFDYVDRHGALFAMFVERGGIAEYDLQQLGGNVVEVEYQRFLRLLLRTVERAAAAGVLRRDVPPPMLVATLSGAMNGVTYAWLKRKRRGRLSASADALLELFFSGAGGGS